MKSSVFALLALIVSARPAYAIYSPNYAVRKQLDRDAEERILPRSPWGVLAADLEVFATDYSKVHPAMGSRGADPYHGSGYWLNIRTELNPVPPITLNLKTSLFSGTASYPYLNASHFQNAFGFQLEQPISDSNWRYQWRGIDLDRVTYGNGLLLKAKETDGSSLSVTNDSIRFTVAYDGTAGHMVPGGLMIYEVSDFDRRVGAYVFDQYDDNMGFETLPETLSVYARPKLGENYELQGEVAGHRHGVAALLGARFGMLEKPRHREGTLFVLAPEIRFHSETFARELRESPQYGYTSYEQQDKDYVDPIYLFGKGVGMVVPSIRAWISRRFAPGWGLYSGHEVGEIGPGTSAKEFFWFYSAGGSVFPIHGRDDEITLEFTNKQLTTVNTYHQTDGSPYYDSILPGRFDGQYKPRFVSQPQLRVFFRTRF